MSKITKTIDAEQIRPGAVPYKVLLFSVAIWFFSKYFCFALFRRPLSFSISWKDPWL